jgi:hypothetical protein
MVVMATADVTWLRDRVNSHDYVGVQETGARIVGQLERTTCP